MKRESRVVHEFRNQKGTLTSSNGKSVKVRFDLFVRQDSIDGMNGLKEADGTVESESGEDLGIMTDGSTRTLQGGGIKAEIRTVGGGRFTVDGAVQGY